MKSAIFILALLFLVVFTKNSYGGFPGDLRFTCNAPTGTVTITMEVVSIPFEGIAQIRKPLHNYNRIDKMFNFGWSELALYLEVQNLLNRKNVWLYEWNVSRYKTDFTYQWARIPILGVSFKF